jgi:hypothetical protein
MNDGGKEENQHGDGKADASALLAPPRRDGL